MGFCFKILVFLLWVWLSSVMGLGGGGFHAGRLGFRCGGGGFAVIFFFFLGFVGVFWFYCYEFG